MVDFLSFVYRFFKHFIFAFIRKEKGERRKGKFSGEGKSAIEKGKVVKREKRKEVNWKGNQGERERKMDLGAEIREYLVLFKAKKCDIFHSRLHCVQLYSGIFKDPLHTKYKTFKNRRKNLSLFHKFKFSHPYILATYYCKPFIFQT